MKVNELIQKLEDYGIGEYPIVSVMIVVNINGRWFLIDNSIVEDK